MSLVFADTGYWVAVLDPKDELHEPALKLSHNLGKVRIVTTEMVFAELLGLLGRTTELRNVVARAVDAIFADPNTEVVPQTSLQFRAAFDRYKARRTKNGASLIALLF